MSVKKYDQKMTNSCIKRKQARLFYESPTTSFL